MLRNRIWCLCNMTQCEFCDDLVNIFRKRELNKDSVTQKIRATASDGKKYDINFYSLDAIIAVGYRVNSVNKCLSNSTKDR